MHLKLLLFEDSEADDLLSFWSFLHNCCLAGSFSRVQKRFWHWHQAHEKRDWAPIVYLCGLCLFPALKQTALRRKHSWDESGFPHPVALWNSSASKRKCRCARPQLSRPSLIPPSSKSLVLLSSPKSLFPTSAQGELVWPRLDFNKPGSCFQWPPSLAI